MVGRYVLEPRVFDHLAALNPVSVGNTSSRTLWPPSPARAGLVAAEIPAKRYDTGNKLDYLKANVEFALKREDLQADFTAYLKELSRSL